LTTPRSPPRPLSTSRSSREARSTTTFGRTCKDDGLVAERAPAGNAHPRRAASEAPNRNGGRQGSVAQLVGEACDLFKVALVVRRLRAAFQAWTSASSRRPSASAFQASVRSDTLPLSASRGLPQALRLRPTRADGISEPSPSSRQQSHRDQKPSSLPIENLASYSPQVPASSIPELDDELR
jgi:hypothetical protein